MQIETLDCRGNWSSRLPRHAYSQDTEKNGEMRRQLPCSSLRLPGGLGHFERDRIGGHVGKISKTSEETQKFMFRGAFQYPSRLRAITPPPILSPSLLKL